MLDEAGKNLDIMQRDDALRLAKERGLDLIEIAPAAKPPVAKIISFDKFRYQKEKELQKQKASQRASELKQVQIGVREAQNDLRVKARKTESFLDEGHKVGITLRLRGREKFNRDWAMQKLEEFMKMISVPYQITFEPKFGGRGLMLQIMKK
ncbi:translation initiation factor IF-3 [Candidatus Wolfebacteria bacterium]|nr:translation initiation factor IF-3 [Candidatus Wolfebacteria bacterium]